MSIIEQRETDHYIANMYAIMEPQIVYLLNDYLKKLEVDDYDSLAVEKMKNVNSLLAKMMDVRQRMGR